MTLPVCHGKIHHAIKNGKPSISIRAIEKTMANCECHNHMVPFFGGWLSIHWIHNGMDDHKSYTRPGYVKIAMVIDGPFILDFPMKKCDFQ